MAHSSQLVSSHFSGAGAMIRYCLARALAVSIAWCGFAAAQDADVWVQNGMTTRLRFSNMDLQVQLAYVAGVTDGIMVSPMVSGNTPRERALAACLSKRQIEAEQIRLTAIQEIRDAPERLDESAHVAIYMALKKICDREMKAVE